VKLQIAYGGKLNECGFGEGRINEIGVAMRRTDVAILSDIQTVVHCKTQACVNAAARRQEKHAQDGIDLMAELRSSGLLQGAPACVLEGLDEQDQSLRALRATARALERADYDRAGREGRRSDNLRARSQRDMAACISSLSQ
jgi:hypothetical protein